MRLHLGALVLAAGLTGMALPQIAQARVRCSAPEGAALVRSSATAVVYRVGRESGQGVKYVGCLRAVGRRWTLTTDRAEGSRGSIIRQVRLAGRYAALQRSETDHDDLSAELLIRVDLRTGRRTTTRARSLEPSLFGGRHVYVDTLLLSSTGALAWRAVDYTGLAADRTAYVMKTTATGSRILDSGPSQDTRQLRLTRRTLTWRRGDVERTASL